MNRKTGGYTGGSGKLDKGRPVVTPVLFYQFIDLYGQDEVAIVGACAVGLVCYYCDIELSGYRAVDHFKLNDQVAPTLRMKPTSR